MPPDVDSHDTQIWIDATRAALDSISTIMRVIEEQHDNPTERWWLLRESLLAAARRSDDEVRQGFREALVRWP